MVNAPTRVQLVQPAAGFGNTTQNLTTPTFDVTNGDLLVLQAFTEDQAYTVAAPTWTGTGTWTLQQSIVVSSYCTAYLYTCPVTATATGRTVSMSRVQSGASGSWSFAVTQWRNHGGLGVTGKANTSGAPSLALSTAANSAVMCGNSDWNSIDGTTRTWRTVNGSAMSESVYFRNASTYTMYAGYRTDTGTAGTTTVGLSAPTGQKYSIIGVEILGSAGGSYVTTGATGVALALTSAGTTVATAAGGLTVRGTLTSAASTVATAAGSLAVALALTAAGSTVAVATAGVGVTAAMSATAYTVYTTTASTGVGVGLSATGSTVAATTGGMGLNSTLTSTASTTATTTGNLSVTAALSATASQAGTYVTTGAMGLGVALAGTGSTVAVSTGGLGLTAALSAVASQTGIYTTTGTLGLTAALGASGSTTASTTGATALTVGLSATASTTYPATTTGALGVAVGMSATAYTVATATGTLHLTLALSGVGTTPSGTVRDLQLTTAPLPNRWTVTGFPQRFTTTQLPTRWITTPEEGTMTTTIYTTTGAAQYVGGTVTDVNGKDISTATYLIGLGGVSKPPTAWVTPDVNTTGATTASRVLKLLVTNTTPVGTYWCWVKVTDNPEMAPLIVQGPITTV